MKIFWAWQSDLPGKVTRHFIRKSLEDAIQKLNQEQDIDEPNETFQSGGFELDHDSKGLAGSPDLANEILKKIENADVFIGDVTPVGKTAIRRNDEGKEFEKKLMNPNVAIELGYGLKSLSTYRLLMIMNSHYGDRSDMPFDMGHKRAPIMYTLSPDATSSEIEKQRKVLSGVLVEALREYKPRPVPTPFPEMKPKIGHGIFFDDGEVLAENKNGPDKGRRFIMSARRVMWLRLFPKSPLPMPLSNEAIQDNIGRFGAFGRIGGEATRRNNYGFIYFSRNGDEIDNLSQYTRDGEVWGINAVVLGQTLDGKPAVPVLSVENEFIQGVKRYCEYMRDIVRAAPPFIVEAGMQGVKEAQLASHGVVVGRSGFPTMHNDSVVERGELKSYDEVEQGRFLERFFAKYHASSGVPRSPLPHRR